MSQTRTFVTRTRRAALPFYGRCLALGRRCPLQFAQLRGGTDGEADCKPGR